jgi:hypothetical protein
VGERRKEGVTLYERKIVAYLALEDLPGREAEHSHLSMLNLRKHGAVPPIFHTSS